MSQPVASAVSKPTFHVLALQHKFHEVQALREHSDIGAKFCKHCFAKPKIACEKCEIAFYCSKKCQKKDWETNSSTEPPFEQGHKEACELLQEREMKRLYREIYKVVSSKSFEKKLLVYKEISLAIFNNPERKPFVYRFRSPEVPIRIRDVFNVLQKGRLSTEYGMLGSPRSIVLILFKQEVEEENLKRVIRVVQHFNLSCLLSEDFDPEEFSKREFPRLIVNIPRR